MVFKPTLDVLRHTGRLVKFHRFEPRICRELHSSCTRNIQIKNIDSEFNLRERKETEERDEVTKKGKTLLREYGRLCAWNDENDLVENLLKNIVYFEPENDKSGLVVLNKPYGLPKSTASDAAYCLESALPQLALKLDVPSLHVLKCCERYTSGITLLSFNKKTEELYRKSMKKVVTNRSLPSSYLAIVKGNPNISKVESVDMWLQDCPDVNEPLFGTMHKEPVLTRRLAKPWKMRQQNDKTRKRVHVSVESVCRSARDVAVVAVSPSSAGRHFLQVYLADIGHPVLGDTMYDYRSRTLLGHKLRITAQSTARRTQQLPDHVLEAVGAARGEEWRLPKLLHHHRLLLPAWLAGGRDLTVYAPPPPHWTNTCDALELNFSFKDFCEHDKVATYNLNPYNMDKKTRKKEKQQKQQEVLTDLQSNINDLS